MGFTAEETIAKLRELELKMVDEPKAKSSLSEVAQLRQIPYRVDILHFQWL